MAQACKSSSFRTITWTATHHTTTVALLFSLPSEKGELERQLSALQQQKLECAQAEQEALRSSSLDIQRQRDLLRQQREDLERQLARERSESERGYGIAKPQTPWLPSWPLFISLSYCLQSVSQAHVVLKVVLNQTRIVLFTKCIKHEDAQCISLLVRSKVITLIMCYCVLYMDKNGFGCDL